MHRVFNSILKVVIHQYVKSWRMGAYIANWCINARPRAGTQHSAFQTLFGFQPDHLSNGNNITDAEQAEGFARYNKQVLSAPELAKHLQTHRDLCMHTVELAARAHSEAQLLRSYDRYYSVNYNVGDLALLARPRIGSRAKGTTTRLMYQNIGPFEIVEKISEVTYRLRKLGTDTISSQHVRYINPYMTKEAHEKKKEKEDVSIGNDGQAIYQPAPGDFMLFMGLPREECPYFLVQVIQYDPGSGDIEFQYFNNTHAKGKYRPVWIKETLNGIKERHANRITNPEASSHICSSLIATTSA